jgi:hypothetical protein
MHLKQYNDISRAVSRIRRSVENTEPTHSPSNLTIEVANNLVVQLCYSGCYSTPKYLM